MSIIKVNLNNPFLMCCSAQYCRDQLLYSREIHVGMYCTFPKQMVLIWTKNILYEAKVVLLNIFVFSLIFVIFSVYHSSEEKSSDCDVVYPVFAHLFGRNTGESPSSCLKSATDMIKGVFLSVNSKIGFRVPFGKSKSGFLIWWILSEKGSIGFKIRRIQIQINGLVTSTVPFTVDSKLVRRYLPVALFPIEVFLYSFLVAAICRKKSENAGRLFLIQ